MLMVIEMTITYSQGKQNRTLSVLDPHWGTAGL